MSKSARLASLVILLAALCLPVLAEQGEMKVIGSNKDDFGGTATVTVVQLGHDKYLAIGIETSAEPDGATAILVKNEVPKFRKVCQRAVGRTDSLKKGEFKILESFGGEQSLAIIRANIDGAATFNIVQINEDGRERSFLLNRKSWRLLQANLKKAEKRL